MCHCLLPCMHAAVQHLWCLRDPTSFCCRAKYQQSVWSLLNADGLLVGSHSLSLSPCNCSAGCIQCVQSASADQYDRPTSLAAAHLIRLCLMVIMQSLAISYIMAYQHDQTMPCCFMLHMCCRSLLPATAPRMSCARSSVTQLSKL